MAPVSNCFQFMGECLGSCRPGTDPISQRWLDCPHVDSFQILGVGVPVCSMRFLQDSKLLDAFFSPCPLCVPSMRGGCQALSRERWESLLGLVGDFLFVCLFLFCLFFCLFFLGGGAWLVCLFGFFFLFVCLFVWLVFFFIDLQALWRLFLWRWRGRKL